jgi:multiple sugar transport system ATP-binding protein
VSNIDGEPRADLGAGGRTRLAPVAAEPMANGTTIIVGIRPEHLQIGTDRAMATATATVTAIEWLGHERHVICRVNDELVVVRQASDGTAPAIGDVVLLGAAPEHIHLFDPSTTERLN